MIGQSMLAFTMLHIPAALLSHGPLKWQAPFPRQVAAALCHLCVIFQVSRFWYGSLSSEHFLIAWLELGLQQGPSC